jgi:phage tail-like protein
MRRAAIERLLPAAYQRAAEPPGLLAALLEVMQSLHAPSEDILDGVDDLFTAYRSPDPMVMFLLGWIAFDHVLPRGRGGEPTRAGMALGRLRNLIAAGADLARRRGTAGGLRGVIEAVTGVVVAVDEPPDRAFHVIVRLPSTAAAQLALITRLVEAEKPAAVTAEVRIDTTQGGDAT